MSVLGALLLAAGALADDDAAQLPTTQLVSAANEFVATLTPQQRQQVLG